MGCGDVHFVLDVYLVVAVDALVQEFILQLQERERGLQGQHAVIYNGNLRLCLLGHYDPAWVEHKGDLGTFSEPN